MTWRAVASVSTVLVAFAACTSYTTGQDGDDDAGTSSGSSSGGTATSSSGSGGGSSGTTSASSGGSGSSSGTVSSSSSSTSASSASSTSGGPLAAFEQGLLNGFNAARLAANPAPTPDLPVLFWDYEGAATCATYTASCSGSPPGGVISGGGSSPLEADIILGLLDDDRAAYTYASNSCTDTDSNCAFYKMTVKRTVTKVGCAKSTCGSQDRWACKFTAYGNLADQPY